MTWIHADVTENVISQECRSINPHSPAENKVNPPPFFLFLYPLAQNLAVSLFLSPLFLNFNLHPFLQLPPLSHYVIHLLSVLLTFHLSLDPSVLLRFLGFPSSFFRYLFSCTPSSSLFMLWSIPLSLQKSKLNSIRCNRLITLLAQVDQQDSVCDSVCVYSV